MEREVSSYKGRCLSTGTFPFFTVFVCSLRIFYVVVRKKLTPTLSQDLVLGHDGVMFTELVEKIDSDTK